MRGPWRLLVLLPLLRLCRTTTTGHCNSHDESCDGGGDEPWLANLPTLDFETAEGATVSRLALRPSPDAASLGGGSVGFFAPKVAAIDEHDQAAQHASEVEKEDAAAGGQVDGGWPVQEVIVDVSDRAAEDGGVAGGGGSERTVRLVRGLMTRAEGSALIDAVQRFTPNTTHPRLDSVDGRPAFELYVRHKGDDRHPVAASVLAPLERRVNAYLAASYGCEACFVCKCCVCSVPGHRFV